MYSVALKDLMARSRQRANIEGAADFIPDYELIDNINQSIAEWIDEVRMCTWAGQYRRSQHSFTAGPASSSAPYKVDLPPDFLAMTSVDIALGNNVVINARAFQEEERNALRGVPVGWTAGAPVYYTIWGNSIAFIPAPTGTFPVVLNYVPIAPTLNDPAATIDSINGLEEFIVLDVAIKCLMKMSETDMLPILQGRLEQQRERIRATVPRRDMATPEVPHVVQFDDSGGMADW